MRTQFIHAVALLVLVTAALRVQAQPVGGREVALSPGTCPTVQDGDIVVFDWNPVFDATLPLAQIEDIRLRFTAPLENRTTRSGTVLELRLRPQRSVAPVEAPFEDIQNGYFRMRFRVNAPTLASGEYHLASSEVALKTPADVPGAHAVMMNDPSRSAFCVTLIATSKEEMKDKRGHSD